MVTSMLGGQSRQAGILMQLCQARLNRQNLPNGKQNFIKHTPFLTLDYAGGFASIMALMPSRLSGQHAVRLS